LSDEQGRMHATRKPVIGLIGGIGSGKSLVANLFADHGGRVIHADELGHEALRQPEILRQVVERFGAGIVDEHGTIVRRRLAEIVFNDDSARRDLESLVFPWIGQRASELIETAQADATICFVVLDAAVMLEAGWNNVCDRLVYVHAPREARLARLWNRGWTNEQIAAREAAQWPLVEKARRADAAIDNSGTADDAARQVRRLLLEWKIPESTAGA